MAGFGGKFGTTSTEPGVAATSNTGCGVAGSSVFNDGVIGESKGAGTAGVRGVNRDSNIDREALVKPAFGFDGEGERNLQGVVQRPVPRPACALLGLHEGIEGTDGHAIRGESNSGDGVWAVTSSSAKTGVFGMNSSRQRPPSNSPGGGNGVFGVSTVPKASGVFGFHHNGGVGVAGFSATGIGVQAGGQTAGEFNGPVNINGDLNVSGEFTSAVVINVPTEEDPSKVVLRINGGLIDWTGPNIEKELIENKKDTTHLQSLPFGVDGQPVGTKNWFVAVQLALHMLDAQVQFAIERALDAARAAGIAQTSADHAWQAAVSQPQPPPQQPHP